MPIDSIERGRSFRRPLGADRFRLRSYSAGGVSGGGGNWTSPRQMLMQACYRATHIISITVTGKVAEGFYNDSYTVKFRDLKGVFARKREDPMPVSNLKAGEEVFAWVSFVRSPEEPGRWGSEIVFGAQPIDRDRHKAIEKAAMMWKKDPAEIGLFENQPSSITPAADKTKQAPVSKEQKARFQVFQDRVELAVARGYYAGAAASLCELGRTNPSSAAEIVLGLDKEQRSSTLSAFFRLKEADAKIILRGIRAELKKTISQKPAEPVQPAPQVKRKPKFGSQTAEEAWEFIRPILRTETLGLPESLMYAFDRTNATLKEALEFTIGPFINERSKMKAHPRVIENAQKMKRVFEETDDITAALAEFCKDENWN